MTTIPINSYDHFKALNQYNIIFMSTLYICVIKMHYELTAINIIVHTTHSILVGVLMLITIIIFDSIQ